MERERGQNTSILCTVPEVCLDGDEFKPIFNEHCAKCPLSAIGKRLADVMPRETLKRLNKRGIRQQLDNPDRPAIVCGITWDLQHGQAW